MGDILDHEKQLLLSGVPGYFDRVIRDRSPMQQQLQPPEQEEEDRRSDEQRLLAAARAVEAMHRHSPRPNGEAFPASWAPLREVREAAPFAQEEPIGAAGAPAAGPAEAPAPPQEQREEPPQDPPAPNQPEPARQQIPVLRTGHSLRDPLLRIVIPDPNALQAQQQEPPTPEEMVQAMHNPQVTSQAGKLLTIHARVTMKLVQIVRVSDVSAMEEGAKEGGAEEGSSEEGSAEESAEEGSAEEGSAEGSAPEEDIAEGDVRGSSPPPIVKDLSSEMPSSPELPLPQPPNDPAQPIVVEEIAAGGIEAPGVETSVVPANEVNANEVNEMKEREDLVCETVCEITAAAGSTDQQPKPKNRCWKCNKKVPLCFQIEACRCGGYFCNNHRQAELHECGFDFKHAGREQLAKVM